MQQVLRELQRRDVVLNSLNAIELFRGSGKRHTVDYANRVASVEVWEIEPSCEETLRINIPQATIRLVDTYQQIRETSKRFDLIVVDNPMSTQTVGIASILTFFPISSAWQPIRQLS